MFSRNGRRALRIWTAVVLVFLYIPLLLVLLNAFNASRTFAFPPTGFTLAWWADAAHSAGMWQALVNSVVVGIAATAIFFLARVMRAAMVASLTRNARATSAVVTPQTSRRVSATCACGASAG